MTAVAKYNISKGVSTVLTAGAPIITLACCGDLFVHRADTAISAAGMFAVLIALLCFKDKLAEKFKAPSAFVLSAAGLVLCILVRNIILPVEIVCAVTLVTGGVDELTAKRIYKRVERSLPAAAADSKILGFLFTTTRRLNEEVTDNGGK